MVSVGLWASVCDAHLWLFLGWGFGVATDGTQVLPATVNTPGWSGCGVSSSFITLPPHSTGGLECFFFFKYNDTAYFIEHIN